MGVGLLDSEESSSSAGSAFALTASASVGADENSNDTNVNIDILKFGHQRTATMCRSNANAADNGNELRDSTEIIKQHSAMGSAIVHSDSPAHLYAGDNQLQKPTENIAVPQPTKVGSNSTTTASSLSSMTRSGRSPLATVVCNRSAKKYPADHQIRVINCVVYKPSDVMGTPENQWLLSCLPSTSQVAQRRQQQQQQQQQHQQQQQLQLQKQQQQLTDCFILNRHSSKNSGHISDGIDHFNRLSDEMVLQVLKWLPKKALLRCGQVCRRLNQCARDETLWTRLDLGGRSLRPGALEDVFSRGVVVLRLAQTQLSHPIFEQKTLTSETIIDSKLQYLDLSLATITKPSLKLLLSCCRQLKKLSLEHVPVNDEICNEIAKNIQLEALNLTMCLGLESWSVRKMMESLKNLNSLNISWTNLSVDAVTSLVTNVTPNLLRLNMAGCRKTMFDSHVSTLSKRCPQILELDLSDCTGLTSNAIGIICKFKMLEYISLSRCYLIPPASYIELANSSSLAYLDVFGMLSDTSLEMLENSFPSIGINKFIHSSVARPTVGTRRTSIWGLRTRD